MGASDGALNEGVSECGSSREAEGCIKEDVEVDEEECIESGIIEDEKGPRFGGSDVLQRAGQV
jgi:hypothetical protein